MDRLTFEVYTNKLSSTVKYDVSKTDEGWFVSHRDCGPNGIPYFYANFEHHFINYPSGFNDNLEYLWEKIDKKEIEREEAQNKLQELANWVSICEKATPKWEY